MSIGLLALLDDVAVFAKVAASSLDDVVGQAAKAGSKAAAVVIDDAAVTPAYVVGFSAQRELPIIFKIARASLKNKIVILLPAAVALGYFLPILITPLLMIGGTYLCYEGAEKIFESLFPHHAHQHEEAVHQAVLTPLQLENKTVLGAVQTDFILSAEIMAISLSTIQEAAILSQIVVLAMVSVVLTVAVYGVVALIVKMDDVGLFMATSKNGPIPLQKFNNFLGRGLVLGMPKILFLLTVIGTTAMTWVGGSIIIHGLEVLGWTTPSHWLHDVVKIVSDLSPPSFSAVIGWLTSTLLQALVGIFVGFLTIPVVEYVVAPLISGFRKKAR
jgi:uncharacterized protein